MLERAQKVECEKRQQMNGKKREKKIKMGFI
jgi:hypothetical protein